MVKPLNFRVVVKPDDAESVSRGGIIIPDESRKKALLGTVVATSKYINIPVDTRVIINRYAGHEVQHEGETLLMLRIDDILAVVE